MPSGPEVAPLGAGKITGLPPFKAESMPPSAARRETETPMLLVGPTTHRRPALSTIIAATYVMPLSVRVPPEPNDESGAPSELAWTARALAARLSAVKKDRRRNRFITIPSNSRLQVSRWRPFYQQADARQVHRWYG